MAMEEDLKKILANQKIIISNQNILDGKLDAITKKLNAVIDNQYRDGDDFRQVIKMLEDLS